jgi:hypothetical protein
MKVYRGTVNPGEFDWQVTVNNSPLNPRHDLVNHSPDGFAWGYSGSGPSQLSLAILADCLQDDDRALKMYQYFKAYVIARLEQDEPFELEDTHILRIVRELEGASSGMA